VLGQQREKLGLGTGRMPDGPHAKPCQRLDGPPDAPAQKVVVSSSPIRKTGGPPLEIEMA
jgi:hypothetical protein